MRRRHGPSADNKGIARLALVLVGVLGFVAYRYFSQSDAVIYVDNGGTEPVTVTVDGDEKPAVPPGQADSFPCRAGSIRIVATRGGQVVFDATKTIEPRGKVRRKYLLNPEATNRYRNAEVFYGESYASRAPHYRPNRDELLRAFAEELSLVPPTDWVDVAPDDVLEAPPKSVQGNISATRRVLTRVAKEDADYVLKTIASWKDQAEYQLDFRAMEQRKKEYSQVEEALKRIEAASPVPVP
jgi:hypothetical protein